MLISHKFSYSQELNASLISSDDIYTEIIDSKGYEWYGTHDGLKRFDGYNYEIFRSDRNNPYLLKSNDVMCLAEHPQTHDIWLGTKNGAFILNTKDYNIREIHLRDCGIVVPVDSMELMDKRINNVLCMKSGNILIAYRNQVLEVDTLGCLLHRYETHWGRKNRSVIQLLEDSLSCIWANLWNGGICRKPKGTDDFMACEWTDTSYPSEIRLDPSLNCIIATTPEGSTYRYALDGTFLSDTIATSKNTSLPLQFVSDEEKARFESLLNEHVLCNTKLGDSCIYIGTFDNIYRYDVDSGKSEKIVSNTGRVHDICVDSEKVYFVSNAKGLCKVVSGEAVQLAKSKNYSSLTIDGQKNIWLSSRMGNVYKTRDNASATLEDDSIAGNLNGDAVNIVRSDGQNRLWILSRNTLKEYNTENEGCKIFNSKDLAIGAFNALYLEDGGVYLVGTESVTHLKNTTALSSMNEINHIAVSSYTEDGRRTLMPYKSHSLYIDSSIDNISLFLTCFVFENAKHITYSYRIDDGYYHELERGTNIISLSSIPYGSHIIYVKGKDSYGRWSEDFNVLSFVHPRPWYHYVIVIILLLSIIGLLIWYLRRRKRFRKKISERMKRYESEREMLEQKLRDAEAKAKDMGYKESAPLENYTSLSVQEKEFVDKCRSLVEKNLSNIEYGVDTLSADMFMSRMNLYRKLKDMIGKSPTDFIRDIRLEHAMMLMDTTSYSINEISDLVGFSYPSYFTKCFKDKFGKSPKDWKR